MSTTPNSVITPQSPFLQTTSLAAVTACTTRAPTATASLAAANIIALVTAASNVNGLSISKISIKACSSSFTATSAAQTVTIWLWDPTAAIAYPKYEIKVDAVPPSTTAISFEIEKTFDDFILEAGQALYVSTSVTTTASTTALLVTAHGGKL